jgi:regulator of protease activity HflC (stomatin/prohibitin superfamily)
LVAAKYEAESFWARYGARTIVYVVGLGLLVLLALGAAGSCATIAKNTEVAIVVNNVTGGVSLLENGGMVFHLPFGLSTVYKLDKSQRVLSLTKAQPGKQPQRSDTGKAVPKREPVSIKTNDGSNVTIEVELVYQIKSSRGFDAMRELSDDENIEDILTALTRSIIRSEFGELSTLEISEPAKRIEKLNATQKRLTKELDLSGTDQALIEIIAINAKSFGFDAEYDKIIRERKETDQILTNQKDYQDAATEEGKRLIAEGTRDKETALAQLQGELAKKLLIAEGEAKRMKTKSEQQAYQAEREGETALRTAEQEAAAVLAEGQRKAEGAEKLMEAYEKGGEGLVREAAAKLYQQVVVKARPYSASEKVDQVRFAPVMQPASTTDHAAPKKPAAAPKR